MRLLLRTGSADRPQRSQYDVDVFDGTPEEVAALARERTGHHGVVVVKDFDTGKTYRIP